MPLRLDFAAGGNLTHVGIVGAAGAVEHNHRTRHALQIPVFELKGVDVLDKKPAHNWNLLLRLPNFIGVDALWFQITGRRRCRH